MRPIPVIIDNFRDDIAELRDTLIADAEPLQFIEDGVRLLQILDRTARELDHSFLSDDQVHYLLDALVPLMNQRLTWMSVYRNAPMFVQSDASSTTESPLPQELRTRFATLTAQQQYLMTEQVYTSMKVIIAEHLLSEWTCTTRMRGKIIVGFLTPVVLHDTKWFFAFSEDVRRSLTNLPEQPAENTHDSVGVKQLAAGREAVVIDLGQAMAELDRLSLVGIARAIEEHAPQHLEPPLTYLAAYRRFVTSDETYLMPTHDYLRFDDEQLLNAKSLLDVMAAVSLTHVHRNFSYFEAAGRWYLVVIPVQADFAAVNSMDEHASYTSNPQRYIVDHRKERGDWKAVRLCAIREEALTLLRRDVRTTQSAEALLTEMRTYAVAFQAAGIAANTVAGQLTNEVLTWMHEYAARAAAEAPAAATKATLRGTLFYFVTKELGGAEPLIIGITEAVVDFLVHIAFSSRDEVHGTKRRELEEEKRLLDLQIAIEKAKRELDALRNESDQKRKL